VDLAPPPGDLQPAVPEGRVKVDGPAAISQRAVRAALTSDTSPRTFRDLRALPRHGSMDFGVA